jgi:hypothetical protein
MEKPSAVTQSSFSSGELSPSLFGRIDLARYYTALKTCRNWIVRPHGGVMNRPGTQFMGEAKNSAVVTRLLDFQANSVETYVLEFGNLTLRFWYRGVLVVYPVGHASAGLPITLVTPWPASVLFQLKVTQSADVMTICHTGYPIQQLSRYAHDHWEIAPFVSLAGPFLDINIDTGITVYSNNTTGTVNLTASTPLFDAADVGRLFYLEQIPDDDTARWEVQKALPAGTLRRAGVAYYVATTTGTTGTVRPTTLEGKEADGDPGVVWEYRHSGSGIVKITAVASGTSATATVESRLPERVALPPVVARTITNVTQGAGTLIRITSNAHGFSTANYVAIAGVVGGVDDGGGGTIPWAISGNYVVTVINANTFDLQGSTWPGGTYTSGGTATNVNLGGASYKWAFSAWGSEQGYPGTTIYHQQRQVFGGSMARPQTIWESRSGAAYRDFGQDNPMLADDALTFDLNARRVNEIRHFVAMRDLVALTSEGAWMIQKDQDSLIPVCNFQGRGGASHLPPLGVGSRTLFVQEKGGAVRSLGYFFESDSYEGKDLTITANHLLQNRTIVDWCFQEYPFATAWIVLDNGQLLGLTYMPEQDVVAWHRHDSINGAFESVCAVSEEDEDAVYCVVRRTINGVTKRYVEKLASRFLEDPLDLVFVDSSLTYDGRTSATIGSTTYNLTTETRNLTTAAGWTYQDTLTLTLNTALFVGANDVGDAIILTDNSGETLRLNIVEYVSGTVVKVQASRTVPVELQGAGTGVQLARNTLSGLDHLEGQTVAIGADGTVHPSQVVTGGSITLSTPVLVAHVGLPITADLETLDINSQGQSLQDKVKNVGSVILLVEETRGLSIGPDVDHLLDYKGEMSGTYDNPIAVSNGAIEMNILSDWSRGGRIFIRQTEPLPATILAAIPQVVVGNV